MNNNTAASNPPRARDLFQFDGIKGDTNSIVDVQGVFVGHNDTSLNPSGFLTGVTAILPQGNQTAQGPSKDYPYGQTDDKHPGIDTVVPAAWFTLNGNGEMTGTHCIDELGLLEGPIMLTNTLAVGTVRNAVIHYAYAQQQPIDPDDFELNLPVVAETYDGWLNEILDQDLQVTEKIAISAIQKATGNQPAEGPVGGGTANTCYSWRGGIGTSSRQKIWFRYWGKKNGKIGWIDLPNQPDKGYTVGVLVQANQGTFWDLVIRGVPVGTIMRPPCSPDNPPKDGGPNPPVPQGPKQGCPNEDPDPSTKHSTRGKNSIIVVIATDAPLLPSQLKRLARRASLGVGRTGTITDNDSGEIFIAFSTNNPNAFSEHQFGDFQSIPDGCQDPLFEAVVNATEEAILNALVAPGSVNGRRHRKAWWILDPDLQTEISPVPKLLDVMNYYNRAANSKPFPG